MRALLGFFMRQAITYATETFAISTSLRIVWHRWATIAFHILRYFGDRHHFEFFVCFFGAIYRNGVVEIGHVFVRHRVTANVDRA